MESRLNNIKQYMELVPILLFCVNIIAYGAYIFSEYFRNTYLMEGFYWILQHFFDSSFTTLFILFYLSIRDRWRVLPKVCFYAVCALWINNIPYVILGYEPGLYFFIFASIIYIATIVIALRILTNR